MIYTNKIEKVLFIIISIIVSVSLLIIFISFIYNNFKRTSFEIITNETINNNVISIDNLDLKPGMSQTSNIKFVCKRSGHYQIDFDFIENSYGDLNKYVVLMVIKDDVVLLNDYLDNIYQNNDFLIDEYFTKDEEINLKLKFEMNEDVGNEAEGTKTDFDIKITIR